MTKHLEGLYVSMSYVRLHMQGSPLVEDKHARLSEITALSEKALRSTQLLYQEIRFFHQYARQVDNNAKTLVKALHVKNNTCSKNEEVLSVSLFKKEQNSS